MTLKQFDVNVQNKPGEVAHIAEALAKGAVNIRGIATERGPTNPMMHIITDDDVSTRKALSNAGFQFKERDILVVGLQNKAGELAKIAKKLERGGVNIDSMFILVSTSPQTEIAIGVDKPGEAQKLLDYS
ncbi:MAG TPA: hypothetical protein VGK23_06670 [Methanomassiliicoccales archaeon]|jgi:hypothetical protein